MKQQTSFIWFLLIIGSIFFMNTCSLFDTNQDDESDRLTHEDITLELVDIDEPDMYSTSSASTRLNRAVKPVPGDVSIVLRATVVPPKASDGASLQASHVALSPDGKYAFVSYMLQGEAVYGALDIFDVSNPSWPVIISTNSFPAIDISTVLYDGSYVYIGGQSIDETGEGNSAYIRALKFTGNKLATTDTIIERSLPGYFTTDIATTDNAVYVTTGTNNAAGTLAVGIYVFKTGTLDDTMDITPVTANLPDVRSITATNKNIAIFEAKFEAPAADAALLVYDTNLDLDLVQTIPLDVTVLPESKAGLGYIGNYFVLAANRSGTVVIDPDLSTPVVTTIPAPNLESIDAANQSSNSVSTGTANSKTIYFISNGESGLWVGDSDSISTTDDWGISGTIRFGEGQSVNYAAAKNSVVVAAVGIGGLKIMELVSP